MVRLIDKEPSLTFEQLLLKDNSASMSISLKSTSSCNRNMYNVKHNLAKELMLDVFQEYSNPCNTRQGI